MIRFPSLFKVICLSFAATQTLASDDALYPEAAPEDASFVRFLGFDEEESVSFGGRTFRLTAENKDAYAPTSAATLKGVDPGHFLSIVQLPNGEMKVIHEAKRSTHSKVYLFLVNATDTPLELRVADGSVAVIESVDPYSARDRAVNPVAIGLGVFPVGSETPIALFDVTLKRGQNLSFLADTSGVRLIENRFGSVVH